MKKLFFLLLFSFPLFFLKAQIVADFENFNIGVDSFLNGSDRKGGFESGAVFLPNQFSSTAFGDFWSGWAISSVQDTLTANFLNQYAAITGSGWDNSNTYTVGFDGSYGFSGFIMNLTTEAQGGIVEGFYITNSTYAYYSMLDGDAFAKRFGGESGNDPDFFQLKVKKFYEGQLQADSVTFYLADFRFEDNSKDYIVKDWTWLDLSALGAADSLLFSLSSSDFGDFGINTPVYFCIDQVIVNPMVSSTNALDEMAITIFPNPVQEILQVTSTHPLQLEVLDTKGHILLSTSQTNTIHVQYLPKGYYWLRVTDEDKVMVKPFVRN